MYCSCLAWYNQYCKVVSNYQLAFARLWPTRGKRGGGGGGGICLVQATMLSQVRIERCHPYARLWTKVWGGC